MEGGEDRARYAAFLPPLLQQVDGYDATIVSGVVTQRGGTATGARPRRLVRGAQGSLK